MSFFETLSGAVTLAKIPGVTGDPFTTTKGFETHVQLEGIEFSFSLEAQATDFNGLFSQVGKAGAVDYDPFFSMSARAATQTGREALFTALENDTIFDSIEIVTFSPNGSGDLVERFRHVIEDARFYGYGTEDGLQQRFWNSPLKVVRQLG